MAVLGGRSGSAVAVTRGGGRKGTRLISMLRPAPERRPFGTLYRRRAAKRGSMCEYALRKHSESTGRVPRRLSLSEERGGGRRLAGRSAYAGAAHIYMSPGGCTIYLRFGSGSLGNPGDFLDSERASRLAGGFGMDIL